jgi:hypothetical protein
MHGKAGLKRTHVTQLNCQQDRIGSIYVNYSLIFFKNYLRRLIILNYALTNLCALNDYNKFITSIVGVDSQDFLSSDKVDVSHIWTYSSYCDWVFACCQGGVA